MLGVILFIIFGAIVGFIADWLDKGSNLSWLGRIVLGVVGAVIGGTLANLAQGRAAFGVADGFNLISFIVAILGALIALFIWKRIGR